MSPRFTATGHNSCWHLSTGSWCSLISIASISTGAAFIGSDPFRGDIKHVLKGEAVSIFSPSTHHHTFPFQWNRFPFCASHFKICNINDQLQMAPAERLPSSAPSRSFPLGFLLLEAALLPSRGRKDLNPLCLPPGPETWLMMVVKMAEAMLMIIVS